MVEGITLVHASLITSNSFSNCTGEQEASALLFGHDTLLSAPRVNRPPLTPSLPTSPPVMDNLPSDINPHPLPLPHQDDEIDQAEELVEQFL
jgi:hypothetical protein